MNDSTLRFSGRAETYQRFRPSYPDQIHSLLAAECGLPEGAIAADIGAGTGILSQLLLNWRYRVLAVEPNPEMRAVADALLAARPGFASVAGTAENTRLEPASVDFITAAQAFHWFDPPAARREFRRILRPEGWVLLIWNQRRDDTPFLQAFEQVLKQHATGYHASGHRHLPETDIQRFFGPEGGRLVRFPYHQPLDWEGLLGRVLSSSYAPLPDEPGYPAMRNALLHLFEEFESGGLVHLEYDTDVYSGRLTGPDA